MAPTYLAVPHTTLPEIGDLQDAIPASAREALPALRFDPQQLLDRGRASRLDFSPHDKQRLQVWSVIAELFRPDEMDVRGTRHRVGALARHVRRHPLEGAVLVHAAKLWEQLAPSDQRRLRQSLEKFVKSSNERVRAWVRGNLYGCDDAAELIGTFAVYRFAMTLTPWNAAEIHRELVTKLLKGWTHPFREHLVVDLEVLAGQEKAEQEHWESWEKLYVEGRGLTQKPKKDAEGDDGQTPEARYRRASAYYIAYFSDENLGGELFKRLFSESDRTGRRRTGRLLGLRAPEGKGLDFACQVILAEHARMRLPIYRNRYRAGTLFLRDVMARDVLRDAGVQARLPPELVVKRLQVIEHALEYGGDLPIVGKSAGAIIGKLKSQLREARTTAQEEPEDVRACDGDATG